MTTIRLLTALAACALALSACKRNDQAFDTRVHDYIVSHPEVIQEAMTKLQEKQDAAAAAQAKVAIDQYRQALEHDPRDFVANPDGKVTVTEFYDYRCPHCINIAPKVVALIRTHPDVRFVFKEMPIFGDTSEHAARAALAAKAQGKDYVGLYDAFMSAHPLTDEEIDRIAASKGVDIAAMNAPAALAKDKAQMADTANLAKKLAIDGTPGFVVGEAFIRGEDDDALATAIATAEHKG